MGDSSARLAGFKETRGDHGEEPPLQILCIVKSRSGYLYIATIRSVFFHYWYV